jgi:hypothetical protein
MRPSPSQPLRPTRRRFLFSTLAVSVLGLGGWATHAYVRRGWSGNALTPSGKATLSDLTRGVMQAYLPAQGPERQALLDAWMQALEEGVRQMTPWVQTQIAALLGSLASPPSRLALTGDWRDLSRLSDAEVAQLLQDMSLSHSPLIQLAYRSMRNFICLNCFSQPAVALSLTPYPGPLDI